MKISKLLIAGVLLGLSQAAIALDKFDHAGPVGMVNSVQLITSQRLYRFDPDMTFLFDASMEDVKAGGMVHMQGYILDGVHYIEVMNVLPDEDA